MMRQVKEEQESHPRPLCPERAGWKGLEAVKGGAGWRIQRGGPPSILAHCQARGLLGWGMGTPHLPQRAACKGGHWKRHLNFAFQLKLA